MKRLTPAAVTTMTFLVIALLVTAYFAKILLAAETEKPRVEYAGVPKAVQLDQASKHRLLHNTAGPLQGRLATSSAERPAIVEAASETSAPRTFVAESYKGSTRTVLRFDNRTPDDGASADVSDSAADVEMEFQP